MMRAKMKVDFVDTFIDGSERITFSAVCKNGYDATGQDEDNTFAKFTPTASLSMNINNPNLNGKIKQGMKFYLDFTEIE